MKRGLNLFVLSALVFVLQFGCNTRTNKKETVNSMNKPVENNLNENENFETFFSQFRIDSVFQLSRIGFPLIKETIGDIDKPENTISEIEPEQWQYLDLTYDPGWATRQMDAYTEKIVINPDSVQLLYEGVNNGIYIEYIFKLKGDNWYLSRWKDMSN